jgi:hypothetical protein
MADPVLPVTKVHKVHKELKDTQGQPVLKGLLVMASLVLKVQ